jgi:hypothetical protein
VTLRKQCNPARTAEWSCHMHAEQDQRRQGCRGLEVDRIEGYSSAMWLLPHRYVSTPGLHCIQC